MEETVAKYLLKKEEEEKAKEEKLRTQDRKIEARELEIKRIQRGWALLEGLSSLPYKASGGSFNAVNFRQNASGLLKNLAKGALIQLKESENPFKIQSKGNSQNQGLNSTISGPTVGETKFQIQPLTAPTSPGPGFSLANTENSSQNLNAQAKPPTILASAVNKLSPISFQSKRLGIEYEART